MNRGELEDILSFDTSAVSFGTLGTFFLSGSFWLLTEYALNRKPGDPISTLMLVCLGFAIFGGFMLFQGWNMNRRKRTKIQRIFDETKPANAASQPSRAKGHNASTG